MSDSDDDLPLSALAVKRPAPDSESDDDLPLSALAAKSGIKPKAKKAAKKVVKKAAKKTVKKASTPMKKATPKGKTPEPLKVAAGSSNTVSGKFYTCTKGMLVKNILARWWYCYVWPAANCIGDAPTNYEMLDGFPGVYLCTKGEKVGDIINKRDMDTW